MSGELLCQRSARGLSAVCVVAAVGVALSLRGSGRGPTDDVMASASIAAREYELSEFQTDALRCLRRVENGRPGREYGVLHPDARDTDELTQARWAAGSIKKRLQNPAALTQFAKRWAPLEADNDPRGLNRYWLGNMSACLAQQSTSGRPRST